MKPQKRRGACSLDRRLPLWGCCMLHGLKLPWASFPGNGITVLGPLTHEFLTGPAWCNCLGFPHTQPTTPTFFLKRPTSAQLPSVCLQLELLTLSLLGWCPKKSVAGDCPPMSSMPGFPFWLLVPSYLSHHLHLCLDHGSVLSKAYLVDNVSIWLLVLPLAFA